MAETDRAIRALRLFGNVEWGKFSLGLNVLKPGFRAPFLLWRYSQPSEDIARTIDSIIQGLPLRTSWGIDTTGRHWLLAPVRLLDIRKQNPELGIAEIATGVAEADQGFCAVADGDADLILEALESSGISNSLDGN